MDTTAAPAPWANRITGHGLEDPQQLLANPRNWRVHPRAQQDALAGALDEIGFVKSVTVNQRTGFVLDGHLRVALAISRSEPSVPVEYVDLSEQEEAIALATLDPIAAMAAADRRARAELLADLSAAAPGLQELLDRHRAEVGPPPDPSYVEPLAGGYSPEIARHEVDDADLAEAGARPVPPDRPPVTEQIRCPSCGHAFRLDRRDL